MEVGVSFYYTQKYLLNGKQLNVKTQGPTSTSFITFFKAQEIRRLRGAFAQKWQLENHISADQNLFYLYHLNWSFSVTMKKFIFQR